MLVGRTHYDLTDSESEPIPVRHTTSKKSKVHTKTSKKKAGAKTTAGMQQPKQTLVEAKIFKPEGSDFKWATRDVEFAIAGAVTCVCDALLHV